MAMMMAAMKPETVQAIIINDVGPEIAKPGLDRLMKYVGKKVPVSNWEEAAKQTEAINRIAFPEATDEDWLKFAKRLYREDDGGCPVIACDPNIVVPLTNNENKSDKTSIAPVLWPVFQQIVDKPILLIRGELSDILDIEYVQKMQQMKPDMEFLEVANVGHAPLLSEVEVAPAIVNFLNNNI